LWWSMRSTIDPRLVGTWIEDSDGPGFFGLRFHADGSQEECETLTNDRPNWTSVWRWSISGDVVTQIENVRPTRNVIRRAKWVIVKLWEKLTGTGWQYEIVELTDSRLTLRPIGRSAQGYRGGDLHRYSRVPDGADEVWKRFSFFTDELQTPEDADNAQGAPPYPRSTVPP
jgi:hypothetical protein